MKLLPRHLACAVVALLLLGLPGCEGERSSDAPGIANQDGSAVSTPADAEAANFEAEGRWIEAATRYRVLALAGQPPASAGLIRQALNAYYMADDPAAGEKLVAEVREKWPGFHEVFLYLADLQRVTMRYDEALRSIEQFLEYEPEHAQGALVSGLIRVALGETESGLKAIDRYLARESTDPVHRAEAEVVRVRALRGLGRRQEAADAMTRLLESRPFDPVVLADAAQTYALARNAVLAGAASRQHQWLSRRGHRLTVEDPVTLYRSGPRPEGRARLALQARDRREFPRAIETLSLLREGDPGDPRLAYLLGRLWLRLGRYRECRQVLDALEKTGVQPTADVLHLRALLLARQGMASEASVAWSRAVALIRPGREGTSEGSGAGTVESSTAILLAAADHLLETDGDVDEANRRYATAAGRSPSTAGPIVGKIRVAVRKGELDRAQALIGQLGARVDPKTNEDYLRLDATVRGLRGDLRLAARQLTALIVKSPTRDQNFAAFMRVFGDKEGVPEVEQVRRLRDQWSAKRRAVEDAAKRLSARPFDGGAAEYHRLGLLAMEMRDREGALDAFMVAADLDPRSTVSLKAALKVLQKPSDVFVRLHSMRRILERDPDDRETLELLARTYNKLGVRSGEAVRIATRLSSE